MNEYIHFKVKKKCLLIIIVVLLSGIALYAYKKYDYEHPDIYVQVSESGYGDIKVEAPHISYGDIPASIELKLQNIVMQHEFTLAYLKDTYKASDIKLNMRFEKDKTLMEYYGKAIKHDGNEEDYKNTIELEYAIDVNLKKI